MESSADLFVFFFHNHNPRLGCINKLLSKINIQSCKRPNFRSGQILIFKTKGANNYYNCIEWRITRYLWINVKKKLINYNKHILILFKKKLRALKKITLWVHSSLNIYQTIIIVLNKRFQLQVITQKRIAVVFMLSPKVI